MRVARLPVTTDRNPYQSLLYRHLRSEGVDLVGNGRLAPEWLEANREAVDLLHVHWRLDRLVDDDEPIEPPRDWTPATAVEATKRLRDQLELARSLGYAIAWTVHEIARLGGDEPTLEHLAAVELGATADVVLTHNPGDAADLSATLARVADDPDERRIRGAAGRAFVRSITWQDTAARHGRSLLRRARSVTQRA